MQAENPVSLYFRSRLQALLAERGVSQRQLALDTGVSQQTINNYVRGVTKLPGAEELLALARYFGVAMETLISEEPSRSGSGTSDDGATPLASPMVSAAEVRRAAGRLIQAAENLRVEAERLAKLGDGPSNG